jgi:hypothetical protein
MPRLLYGLTGIILLAIWLGIATKFAMSLESAEARNAQGNAGDVKLSGAFSENSIMFFMSGSLNSFDPDTRDLSEYSISEDCQRPVADLDTDVDWSAYMVQGPIIGGLSNATQVAVEDAQTTTTAIYRDTVARPDTELAANITTYVPYRLKAPGIKPIGYLGISNFDQVSG